MTKAILSHSQTIPMRKMGTGTTTTISQFPSFPHTFRCGNGKRERECDPEELKGITLNKIRIKPVVTLADLTRAAWPQITGDPVHVPYLDRGQPHSAKLRGKVLAGVYVGIVCPGCGQTTENLYQLDGRPGAMCERCVGLYSEGSDDAA